MRLAAGTYVCVEIADNGGGIEPEVLPRIFEPFFTTKGKPHRGLGLALVYGIVTNHGGGVAVSSQPGTGTSVRVYLPAEKELRPGNRRRRRESARHGNHPGGGRRRSVADDGGNDPGGLRLQGVDGQQRAEGAGDFVARGHEGGSGHHGPGDAGHGRARTGRAHPAACARTTKILCTSGYVLPADKQSGTAYLQKPFTSQELLRKGQAGRWPRTDSC